jgi:hypothetical protein
MKKQTKSIYRLSRAALLSGAFVGITSASVLAQSNQGPVYQGKVGKTLADSKEWWPAPVKAPKGAPNVIWILLDDVGFGATSAFGGVISTPTYDSLANNGLRYTNFHTAAICAPTRAALLTGRNHHYVHMGGFAHTILSAGFPGYDGRIPADKGTVAEILRENGYNTFAVGKYGLTPDEDATDAGPFDRWPSGKGFDHFFGFLGSQTDQYKPDLVEDNAHVKPASKKRRPISHFSFTMRPVLHMRHTRLPKSGATNIKVSLTKAGMFSGKKYLHNKSLKASFQKTRYCRPAMRV